MASIASSETLSIWSHPTVKQPEVSIHIFFSGWLGSPWAGCQQSQDLQDQTIHHLNWQVEDGWLYKITKHQALFGWAFQNLTLGFLVKAADFMWYITPLMGCSHLQSVFVGVLPRSPRPRLLLVARCFALDAYLVLGVWLPRFTS